MIKSCLVKTLLRLNVSVLDKKLHYRILSTSDLSTINYKKVIWKSPTKFLTNFLFFDLRRYLCYLTHSGQEIIYLSIGIQLDRYRTRIHPPFYVTCLYFHEHKTWNRFDGSKIYNLLKYKQDYMQGRRSQIFFQAVKHFFL